MASSKLVTICLLVTITLVSCQRRGKQPTISDHDVNRVLSDPNYVKTQIDCVLNRARCDNTGNQLKFALPEVIGNNCRKCNSNQMRNARKITNFVAAQYPREYAQIQKKYGRGRRG